jgi:transcriptional regulator
MRAFVAQAGFGMVFATTPAGPRVAHVAATFLDDDRIGFHLARGNALAGHIEHRGALFVANGPDAYVSPDWYGLEDQVPTWNYVSVELEGRASPMGRDDLAALIDALSHDQERRLAPKPIWTKDKMSDGLVDRMLGAVTGYAFHISEWRGTLKLGQNKPEAARHGVADALDALGKNDVGALMRGTLS